MVGEEARIVREQEQLTETEMEILNQKINLIADVLEDGHHPILTFTYFLNDRMKQGGSYVTMTERVRKIDAVNRKIVLYKTVGTSQRYMEENAALKKLSEIVKPKVIGIRPLEPIHTIINYDKLGELIEEAADSVVSEQVRSDNLSGYDTQLSCEEDRSVNDMKAAIIAFLRNIGEKQQMRQISAEFAEYITKCYYALKF